jgi:hypothetical protein
VYSCYSAVILSSVVLLSCTSCAVLLCCAPVLYSSAVLCNPLLYASTTVLCCTHLLYSAAPRCDPLLCSCALLLCCALLLYSCAVLLCCTPGYSFAVLLCCTPLLYFSVVQESATSNRGPPPPLIFCKCVRFRSGRCRKEINYCTTVKIKNKFASRFETQPRISKSEEFFCRWVSLEGVRSRSGGGGGGGAPPGLVAHSITALFFVVY